MLSDYRRRRLLRRLERVMCRVLELDELLCKDAAFDEERARAIQAQIRQKQKRLVRIYKKLDLLKAEG